MKYRYILVVLFMMFISIKNVWAYDTKMVKGTYCYNYAKKELDILNKERTSNGLNKLIMDEELFIAANKRAAEITIYMDESHYRPNKQPFYTVSDKVIGENTGYIYGYKNKEEIIHAKWMKSDSHRANILNSEYKSVGIGCFKYNNIYYFVEEFGFESNKHLINYPKNKSASISVEIDNKKTGVSFDKSVYKIYNNEIIKVYISKLNIDNLTYNIYVSNDNINIIDMKDYIYVKPVREGITQLLIKYDNGEYASSFIINGNQNKYYYNKDEYIQVAGTTIKDADMLPKDTINNYKFGIKNSDIYYKSNILIDNINNDIAYELDINKEYVDIKRNIINSNSIISVNNFIMNINKIM